MANWILTSISREWVYGDKERNLVIDTVRKGFPLNSMYWADIGNDKYEVIDGPVLFQFVSTLREIFQLSGTKKFLLITI